MLQALKILHWLKLWNFPYIQHPVRITAVWAQSPLSLLSIPASTPCRMEETTKEWPHVYAKLPFNHNLFLDKFSANHCHAVYGDHIEDLKMVCRMLNIQAEVLGEAQS